MVRSEEAYKSFQIYRPVLETPAMQRFMKGIDEIAKEIFAPDDLIQVREKIATDDSLPEPMIRTRGVGISRHRLYDTERLKLTLLDKRSPQAMARPLLRAYERFISDNAVTKVATRSSKNRQSSGQARAQSAPDWRAQLRQAALKYGILDPEDPNALSELKVTFDTLAVTTNPGYETRGIEFSLFPSPPRPEALLLHDEASICFSALALANRNLAYPIGKINPQVAVIRLPSNATPEQTFDFHVETSKRLPLDLELGVPIPDIT